MPSLNLQNVDWQGDVHWFDFEDLCLLLDVNSGAVHIIDAPTRAVLAELRAGEEHGTLTEADWLALLPRSTREWGAGTVLEVCQELAAKQAGGTLFTVDEVGRAYRPPEPSLQALCLHVAHDCNMRCRYCFAGGGPFGGERGLMSRETGYQALDLLFNESGSRPRVEIDFFGGEPLLNFGVVQELVAYGRERAAATGKKISFTLTTNGLGLTPAIEEYLIENQISVILSLDGRPEVHDLNRRTVSGQGTYHLVVPREQHFVAAQGHRDYWVRGTYTSQNLDFTKDILHMVELGFRYLSLEPVVAAPEAEYAIKEEDLPRLAREYRYLARAYLEARAKGKPFNFFHFNIDAAAGPCLTKRLTGCGAGTSYLAVTPGGDLYPCHQLVGRRDYCLGNVREGILRPDLREDFRQAYVYNQPACSRCWARFYCSGGCHAANLAATGNLRQPAPVPCAIQKIRLEAAIYVQVKEVVKG
ncbi:SCIFF radical SAM maturase [Moorella glycerini]|uniref:Anaerobic sulfatase-maturating enzyme n=1 Tax=Neomoorella stamsii TaxID=1266720 RepID=A0A9X7J0Z2_9FIRM|nr:MULTISPECIES: thioether cross-link-forming SCIFF peptide maturase [Moorella]PRR70644.1 Anaerobic sulfatase-maturating enzyme [Moorella stamsii]CEP68007.1 SCIFF radical SAM maturase [Moorella glycerini]